jgi:UDP-2-acetamido-2,6-beta-L-arabino-hexul-4-ose reductase
MRVLVTGADGFIARNLISHLRERKDIEVITFTKRNTVAELQSLVTNVDCIFHLAGINRPVDPAEFMVGNADLTQALCDAVGSAKKPIKFIFSSSTQAMRSNAYGESKHHAEVAVEKAQTTGKLVPFIFRLPNVFGKWCRPNYNSAVATFCYNISRELPIFVNDRAAPLTLVYVDDVVAAFLKIMDEPLLDDKVSAFSEVAQTYQTTVGDVADIIGRFHSDRRSLKTSQVGTGLHRALYATYVSYIAPLDFSYVVPRHADERGVFVEMLKTETSGQFSFFSARPGITRGGHYHHSKSEKFLVICGKARFCFRNILTEETYEIFTDGENSKVVDTAPGWAHDITNVGDDELIVMLWANEVFDRDFPDTYASSCGALCQN